MQLQVFLFSLSLSLSLAPLRYCRGEFLWGRFSSLSQIKKKTDNLGIAHYAAPGTQQSSSKVGLRILHRTTVAGETIPQKLSGEKSYLLG